MRNDDGTHEKTHQTMLGAWRLIFKLTVVWLAFTFLASSFGCAHAPTSADGIELTNKNEILIYELTQCYAKYNGMEALPGKDEIVSVVFTNEIKWAECQTWDGKDPGVKGAGPDGQCLSVGWAYPGIRSVNYYRPYVRGQCDLCLFPTTSLGLNDTAAHESAHIRGTWDHGRQFQAWYVDALRNANCFNPEEPTEFDPTIPVRILMCGLGAIIYVARKI